MKKLSALICLGLVAGAVANPVVSNIRVTQRENTKLVDVLYDVLFVGGDEVDISFEVSSDGGTNYDVVATTFSGDYGANVSTGSDRQIVWNAGADWDENYSEQMKVRITAEAPRFEILDDDGYLVRDGNTGLVWNQRVANEYNLYNQSHIDSTEYYFYFDGAVTNLMSWDWRFPTYQEFIELADGITMDRGAKIIAPGYTPEGLPYGHPFFNAVEGACWTSEIAMVTSDKVYIWGFTFAEREYAVAIPSDYVVVYGFLPWDITGYAHIWLVADSQ